MECDANSTMTIAHRTIHLPKRETHAPRCGACISFEEASCATLSLRILYYWFTKYPNPFPGPASVFFTCVATSTSSSDQSKLVLPTGSIVQSIFEPSADQCASSSSTFGVFVISTKGDV